MKNVYRAIVFIGFLLFGIIINLQFRGILLSKPNAGTSAKELAIELENERNENKRILEQLENIEFEREQLWQNMGNNLKDQRINDLLKQRDYEYLRAGLTSVTGSGVVITLEDAPAKGELDVGEYIIHDSNVNDILSALKSQGAQAISVNGERVVFDTKPVCAGPTIIVNEGRYPPPYVIEAIGDSNVLYNAVETLPQVAFMRLTNIRINTEKKDDITINRYRLLNTSENLLKGVEVIKQ